MLYACIRLGMWAVPMAFLTLRGLCGLVCTLRHRIYGLSLFNARFGISALPHFPVLHGQLCHQISDGHY